MKKFTIMQWGSKRSIVELSYSDTNEKQIIIIDNNYLMNLDEMGLVR